MKNSAIYRLCFYLYRNSHYDDKTISRPSCLYNGDPYTCEYSLHMETGRCILPKDALVSHNNPWNASSYMPSAKMWAIISTTTASLNTLRPGQNGRHIPDDIFKLNFLNEKIWISIKVSMKCVTRGPVKNIPALDQIMAWRGWGDKPLSEAMMVSLLTHICVTRPQWVEVITLNSVWHCWLSV